MGKNIKEDSGLKSGKELKGSLTFRIEPSKRDTLEKHFTDQGRTLSNGLQWVLDQYMKDNGLV